jgi:hypothetical protein
MSVNGTLSCSIRWATPRPQFVGFYNEVWKVCNLSGCGKRHRLQRMLQTLKNPSLAMVLIHFRHSVTRTNPRLLLSGHIATLRFMFAHSGVNEWYGDFSPIDRLTILVVGWPASRNPIFPWLSAPGADNGLRVALLRPGSPL